LPAPRRPQSIIPSSGRGYARPRVTRQPNNVDRDIARLGSNDYNTRTGADGRLTHRIGYTPRGELKTLKVKLQKAQKNTSDLELKIRLQRKIDRINARLAKPTTLLEAAADAVAAVEKNPKYSVGLKSRLRHIAGNEPFDLEKTVSALSTLYDYRGRVSFMHVRTKISNLIEAGKKKLAANANSINFNDPKVKNLLERYEIGRNGENMTPPPPPAAPF